MQQVGLPLHLVEDQWLTAPKKCIGLAARQVDHIEVVQGQEATSAGRQLLDQGTLARLARPGYHHRRHDSEALLQA